MCECYYYYFDISNIGEREFEHRTSSVRVNTPNYLTYKLIPRLMYVLTTRQVMISFLEKTWLHRTEKELVLKFNGVLTLVKFH